MKHISLNMRGMDILTIDLTTSGYTVKDGYRPDVSSAGQDTDKIGVVIQGSTKAELISRLRAIAGLLDFAKNHPTGPNGVWIKYSPDYPAVTPWESRITNGSILHNNKLEQQIEQLALDVELVIEREPLWEAATAVQLDLWNSIGAGQTISLVNHYDVNGNHDIYAAISAGELEGDMPAPAIVEFANTTNDAHKIINLFVGHSVAGDTPSPEAYVLEGAGAADATCSSGSYAGLSWTGTTETMLVELSITQSMWQRYYKILTRFRDVFAYTDLYLKAKILLNGIVLTETPWAIMSANRVLQQLGTLRIPPIEHIENPSMFDIGYLKMQLFAKRAGGSGTINLDFVAMLPQDSWIHYQALTGKGISYNGLLQHNPRKNSLTTWEPTPTITHIIQSGSTVMLVPGRDNFLFFLHDLEDGSAPIERTSSIKISYHPRRRTL